MNTIHQVNVEVIEQEPLRRIWTYVGYDEPNYTYTERGRELLGKLGKLPDGPYFIRCHFLLCTGDGTGSPKWGSTNAYTEQDGKPVYDFTIIDRILDTYLECGCTPFVELGFMPEVLSAAPDDLVYASSTLGSAWAFPPKSYEKWQQLITKLAEHCLERYGLREVSRWYWELWNEPDLPYWRGTIEEFNQLYDYTEAGLHSILPQAYLGGPATCGPCNDKAAEYLEKFLEHCAHGVNAITGTQGTRLDFISFHTKGGSYRKDSMVEKQTPSIQRLVAHVSKGLDILHTFPQFKGLEVVLSECDPDGWAAGSIQDNWNLQFRNTEYYASYLANTVCKLMDLGQGSSHRVDAMLTWAFQFEDREYFAGLRTLSTNGIDKPVLNVFRLLAKLGNQRLPFTSDGYRNPQIAAGPDLPETPPDLSGLATIDGSGIVGVFLSCHHDDWDQQTKSTVHLQIRNLTAQKYHLQQWLIDQTHANSFNKWTALESPQQPSAEQLTLLKAAAQPQAISLGEYETEEGAISLELALKTHSVSLLEFIPLP